MFLNCWVYNPLFLETAKTCLDREVEGNNMWRFHKKLKTLSNTLSACSKKKFCNIFQNVKLYEEKIHKAEQNYILYQSDSNRTVSINLMPSILCFLRWKILY